MEVFNRILVISDLHLADGSNTDDFSRGPDTITREEKLIAFIEAQQPDQIYINGDIFELWQVKMPKILIAHQKIVNFIESDSRIHKIVGNHDFSLLGILNVDLQTQNGKKILIMHGFQHEKRFQNKIGRFFCWILGKIELLIPGIENMFAKKRCFNKGLSEKVKKYGKSFFKKGYDIVICAHSHYLELEEENEKIYANSGAVQEGRLEGILIDGINGTVSIVKEDP